MPMNAVMMKRVAVVVIGGCAAVFAPTGATAARVVTMADHSGMASFHIRGVTRTANGAGIAGAEVGYVSGAQTGAGPANFLQFEMGPFQVVGHGGEGSCTIDVPPVQTNAAGGYDVIVFVTSNQGCVDTAYHNIPNGLWASKGGFQFHRAH